MLPALNSVPEPCTEPSGNQLSWKARLASSWGHILRCAQMSVKVSFRFLSTSAFFALTSCTGGLSLEVGVFILTASSIFPAVHILPALEGPRLASAIPAWDDRRLDHPNIKLRGVVRFLRRFLTGFSEHRMSSHSCATPEGQPQQRLHQQLQASQPKGG